MILTLEWYKIFDHRIKCCHFFQLLYILLMKKASSTRKQKTLKKSTLPKTTKIIFSKQILFVIRTINSNTTVSAHIQPFKNQKIHHTSLDNKS